MGTLVLDSVGHGGTLFQPIIARPGPLATAQTRHRGSCPI